MATATSDPSKKVVKITTFAPKSSQNHDLRGKKSLKLRLSHKKVVKIKAKE